MAPVHLSPQARESLLNTPQGGPPADLTDLEVVSGIRDATRSQWLASNEQLAGRWVTRPETVAGVPVVRFAADEQTLSRTTVIVHLHGGAFVFGSPIASAGLIVPVAQRTNLPVVSIDYRLAPEHPFPAAADDAVSVCAALTASGKVAAAYGESAGACLALAAAVSLRDAGAAVPGRLGLLSPWVDLTCSGDTYRTLAHADPVLGALDPTAFAAVYAGRETDDPSASPLFADLAGLPPTLIQVGSREILLSDSCRLDAALRKAGVATAFQVWDGLWHGWQLRQHIPEAVRALEEAADFLTPVGR